MRHRMRPPSGKLSQQIRAANAEVQGRLDALLEADRFGPTPSHKGGLLPPLQEAKRDLGKVRAHTTLAPNPSALSVTPLTLFALAS